MSLAELRAIARALETTVTALKTRFGIGWDPASRRYELEAGPGGCPLLDGDHCSVHAVKPAQCAAFPYWPELIEDGLRWRAAKSFCEGLDHPDGPFVPLAEMRARARRAGIH